MEEDTAKVTLLDLPQEILEHVAEFLAFKDLTSFRLVCRQIDKNVIHKFAELFFSNQAYVLSDIHSFETFVSIAGHETFGKALRRLTFCVDELDYNAYVGEPDVPDNDLYRLHCVRRNNFKSSKRPLQLLSLALERLRLTGMSGKIVVFVTDVMTASSQYTMNISPHGMTTLLHELNDRRPRLDFDYGVQLVIEALSSSALEICGLAMFSYDSDRPRWPDVYILVLDRNFDHSIRVFSKLKYLDLILGEDAWDQPLHDDRLVELFMSLSALENLSLLNEAPYYTTWITSSQVVAQIVLRQYYPNIRRIYLDHLRMDIEDFERFIQRNIETLQQVEAVDSEFCWSSTYAELRSVPLLGFSLSEKSNIDDAELERFLKQRTGFSEVEFSYCQSAGAWTHDTVYSRLLERRDASVQ